MIVNPQLETRNSKLETRSGFALSITQLGLPRCVARTHQTFQCNRASQGPSRAHQALRYATALSDAFAESWCESLETLSLLANSHDHNAHQLQRQKPVYRSRVWSTHVAMLLGKRLRLPATIVLQWW